MQDASTFVGLDVHKNTIAVALLRPGQPPLEWSLANETAAICRLIRKLEREAVGALRCCYEAGPTGFVLQRQLNKAGIDCRVVAPSLIPVKPGARIKTDRRDALKLAELDSGVAPGRQHQHRRRVSGGAKLRHQRQPI